MGFAFVLGAAAPVVLWLVEFNGPFSFTFALASTVFATGAFSDPPLLLRPSSKNLLLPSAGLATPEVGVVALVAENVRLAVLGLRTLMPVSLRWYEASLLLLALAQSKPLDWVADDEGVSLRQLPQIAGLLPVRGVVIEALSAGVSSRSDLMLNDVRLGRAIAGGLDSLSEPVDLVVSLAPVSAAIAPGGRYLLGGGLAAVEETEAVELP